MTVVLLVRHTIFSFPRVTVMTAISAKESRKSREVTLVTVIGGVKTQVKTKKVTLTYLSP